MWVTFGCIPLPDLDQAMLFDDKHTTTNIMGSYIFDKVDSAEAMRKRWIDRMMTYPKCRMKIVRKFGIHWMQTMYGEELERKKQGLVPVLDSINSQADIQDFMAKVQPLADWDDQIPIKFHLVPDYTPTKSALILKVHHCFGDGQAIAGQLVCSTDNPQVQHVPSYFKMSIPQQVMYYALLPLLIIYSIYETISRPQDKPTFLKKKGVAPSGNKRVASEMGLSTAELNEACWILGCNEHSLLMALFSCTMHEYLSANRMDENGVTYAVPKSLRFAQPLSLRTNPEKIDDMVMTNDQTLYFEDLRLFSNFY
mmetsp:Transcript_6615/g.10635  ORF Transcript_6615/g.10635 Transcript_6615/m.10635 type:complete len:310 (+) Transcript_6615:211-1140(+)